MVYCITIPVTGKFLVPTVLNLLPQLPVYLDMRVRPSIMALPVAMAPAEVWYMGRGEYRTSFSVS
jgi:hypothetical protein